MKKAKLVLCITVILIGDFMGYREGFSLEPVNYPTRDIVCIVPFVPGGACDVVARSSIPYLRRYLPRQVNIVVQNVGAAGGRVGSFQVYDAKPDGYTISVMEPMVFVVAEAMGESQKKITHMNWLPRASTQPFMMGFSSQSPIKTIDDLKKAKRVRAAVTQSIVAGTIAFLEHLGTDPQPVMYGGGAEACLGVYEGRRGSSDFGFRDHDETRRSQ